MTRASKLRASGFRAAAGRDAVSAGVRRAREVELGSCALVLAAQQVMCTIPLLIVLAAIRPAGSAGNFGDQLGRYLGLSAKARHELASVFAGPAQVRSAATLAGIVLLAIFTVGVAQAHERAYELAWRVDHKAPGAWRRQARWVAALAGYVAAVAAVSHALGGLSSHRLAFVALCAPVSLAFYWWSQRTLLAGRVPARSLLPGAALIAAGITLLLVLSPALISAQINSNVHEFGLIGVTFVLATWQLALSVLILGGATAGAAIVEHREISQEPTV